MAVAWRLGMVMESALEMVMEWLLGMVMEWLLGMVKQIDPYPQTRMQIQQAEQPQRSWFSCRQRYYEFPGPG